MRTSFAPRLALKARLVPQTQFTPVTFRHARTMATAAVKKEGLFIPASTPVPGQLNQADMFVFS